jgi:hypothetical protein
MGDVDNLNISETPGAGAGRTEATAEQVEAFREAMRRAQARRAQQKKQEGKAKKSDHELAVLIVRFLNDARAQDILEPLVPILAKGISVNLILGLLSLAYHQIHLEIYKNMDREAEAHALIVRATEFEKQLREQEKRDFDTRHLPPEVKERINLWIQDILTICLDDVEKALRFVYEAEQKIDRNLILLTKRTLISYLERNNINCAKEPAREFANFIIRGIIIQLSNKAKISQTMGDSPSLLPE